MLDHDRAIGRTFSSHLPHRLSHSSLDRIDDGLYGPKVCHLVDEDRPFRRWYWFIVEVNLDPAIVASKLEFVAKPIVLTRIPGSVVSPDVSSTSRPEAIEWNKELVDILREDGGAVPVGELDRAGVVAWDENDNVPIISSSSDLEGCPSSGSQVDSNFAVLRPTVYTHAVRQVADNRNIGRYRSIVRKQPQVIPLLLAIIQRC